MALTPTPNAQPPAQPSVGALVPPAPQQAATPPATPQAQQQLQTSWQDYLKNPAVQAGLIQFGIDALQPARPGQTTAGHIAGAVAGGGEAVGRVKKAREEREAAEVEAGFEERRVTTGEKKIDVQEALGKEAQVIRREEIAAKKQIAEEGIDAHAARLQTEIQARIDLSADTEAQKLLGSLIRDETQRYNAKVAATIPGDPLPAPPTITSTMSKFKILNAIVKNKGVVPDDGTITDEEFVGVLSTGTEAQKQQIRTFMGFMTPEQQARIQQKLSAIPEPVVTPEPETAPNPGKPLTRRERRQKRREAAQE